MYFTLRYIHSWSCITSIHPSGREFRRSVVHHSP